jgi:hypothetical protein
MKESQQKFMEVIKLMDAKLQQVDKQLQTQNAEMREALNLV